jgi:hypothetical protein
MEQYLSKPEIECEGPAGMSSLRVHFKRPTYLVLEGESLKLLTYCKLLEFTNPFTHLFEYAKFSNTSREIGSLFTPGKQFSQSVH